MMHKQMTRFDRAYALDFAAITALPSVSIRPTLEYDGKPHQLAISRMFGSPDSGTFRPSCGDSESRSAAAIIRSIKRIA